MTSGCKWPLGSSKKLGLARISQHDSKFGSAAFPVLSGSGESVAADIIFSKFPLEWRYRSPHVNVALKLSG